jgi:UDP-N-acetylmuramoyl-L-alanyl-D-glutamate--2,6-diaminopimelate ligase
VDIAIITDEDPFDENPQDIIHAIADAAIAASSSSPSIGEVRRGTPKVIGQTLFRNPDRRGAIAKALSLAQPGDLVLITGKGAEQKIARAGGYYEPWDDRVIVKEILSQLQQ